MSDEKDTVLTDEVRGLEAKPRSENTAEILNEKRILTEPLSDADARKQMAAYSRRGFLVGGAAALLGVFGWRWMSDETRSNLLRRSFEFNERVSQVFYSPKRLAPEFPPERITFPRVNGMLGLEQPPEPNECCVYISMPGIGPERAVGIEEIKRLPRTDMLTELKCIEGWSFISHWGGVRFSDLIAHLVPGIALQDLPRYVSLSTPDQQYYVGWDIESILHPQTLLAYEQNAAPLTPEHGAPLRLASPTKYGIKLIKRIGRIEFTNERPRDYWAEQGYDWYAGH